MNSATIECKTRREANSVLRRVHAADTGSVYGPDKSYVYGPVLTARRQPDNRVRVSSNCIADVRAWANI